MLSRHPQILRRAHERPVYLFFAVSRLLRLFGYLAMRECLKVLDHALLRVRSNQAHNGQFTDMPFGSRREREIRSRTGWERREAYAVRLAILTKKLVADRFPSARAKRLTGLCMSPLLGALIHRELGANPTSTVGVAI